MGVDGHEHDLGAGDVDGAGRRADDARRQDARGGLDRHERHLVALALGVRRYLSGTNSKLNAQLHGALHLVDLAGSERLDRSGATSEAAKNDGDQQESLDALARLRLEGDQGRRTSVQGLEADPPDGTVPLGAGEDADGGQRRPEADNAQETLCSLRFASQVNQCDVGGPVKSAKPMDGAGGAPQGRAAGAPRARRPGAGVAPRDGGREAAGAAGTTPPSKRAKCATVPWDGGCRRARR